MKIVEAITDTNIGGAGLILLTRLIATKEMADKTTVIIPKDSALKPRLISNGIKYIEIDGCRDRSFEISGIIKYSRILKELSPDIVNCHGCLSCRIAAYICNVKVRIYTRHCSFPLEWWQKNMLYRFFFGLIQATLSHKVIAVADAAKTNLIELGVREKMVSVIINGVIGLSLKNDEEKINIRRELNIPANATVVSIFARLETCKGHKDFLRAAAFLISRSNKYRFLIVGDGSEREELERFTKQLKLDKYVIYTGFAEDVSKYFNITDINVNCSIGTETSSLAISEGMSLGIPCVASEYGGNTYMVRNGNNGFTYPIGNYEALGKRILLLSASRTLYNKMSENAYKRFCDELNAKSMSRQTYALYKELFADS